jgi:hypothetical protein
MAGEVREIVMLPHRALLAIDIGQLIWAEVLQETIEELALTPGARVTCLIKASAATAIL